MGLFAQFRQEVIFTSEIFHHAEGRVVNATEECGEELTPPTMAGSLGIGGWFSLGAAGPSSMRRSFTSLPRKTMKS